MAELMQIIPREIYNFMCLKAYEKIDPPQEDNPTRCGCSSLDYIKKSLSYFTMPKTRMPLYLEMVSVFNPEKGMGNPTKSRLVNGLIKAVLVKETKGLGKDSKADRRFSTDKEYTISLSQ